MNLTWGDGISSWNSLASRTFAAFPTIDLADTLSPPSLSQNITLKKPGVPQKILFVYPANKVQQNLGRQRSSDQAGTW
jgi:hypothetical protein